MDWNSIKFRASSWGNLMTEPQTKAAKEAGELSKTCQKELVKIYNQVKYGRKKETITKHMEKGILAEPESIILFSRMEKQVFYKNEEQLENEWFCGHPDIFIGENIENSEQVWDIKSSWELDTFMPKLVEEVDNAYNLQLQVYFSLTGAQSGGIAYCLVSAPPSVLQGEQRRLLYSMDVISEESPDFKKAAAELEKNMVFEDIPPQERVIKHPVTRDDELIQKMKDKVPKLRQWLADFEEKHLSQY